MNMYRKQLAAQRKRRRERQREFTRNFLKMESLRLRDCKVGQRVEGFTGSQGTGRFGTIVKVIPQGNAQKVVLRVRWDDDFAGKTCEGRMSPLALRLATDKGEQK